jgi:uncharacterized protein
MLLNLIVIQPIDLCNLNCSYCYLPGRKDKRLMTETVLQASLRCIFNSSMIETKDKEDRITLLWHSGEPLTAGVKFYENALKSIKVHNKRNLNIDFEIQSNATLIDQEWCDFIKNNDISLAVSVDGPEFIHDKHRKNWSGKGSHKLVMKGLEHLDRNSIPLRAICVVTKDSLDYPHEIYNFFKNNKFEGICFNIDEQECINENTSFYMKNYEEKSVIIGKYKNFMQTIYDLWEKDKRTLRIREFDRILQLIKFRKDHGFSRYLPHQETIAFCIVTITKEGDITLFSPELSGGTKNNPKAFTIGNVLNINSLDDLFDSEAFLKQFNAIKKGVEKCAQECTYFEFCGGGSPSNKYYENESFETTETTHCLFTQKILFDLVADRLREYQPSY